MHSLIGINLNLQFRCETSTVSCISLFAGTLWVAFSVIRFVFQSYIEQDATLMSEDFEKNWDYMN